MADKNIQIKDVEGNLLFPKTKAAVVLNNSNENLGTVQAGAQVNVIEEVQVNGTALTVTDKKVNVVIPAADEYTLAKQATAEEGMSATYYMTKNGTQVGEKINIPKDMVVESGDLKVCAEADKPVAGLAVGDPYIDLVIANKANSHIYIPVKGLVDIYTAGDDTIIVENNTIKVSLDELKKTFYTETEVDTELAKKVDKLTTKPTAGTFTKVTINAEGQVTAGASLVQDDIPSLNLTKISDVTATAAEVNVLDGIEASTAELNFVKGVTSSIQTQLNGKQANLTEAQLAACNSEITKTIKEGYDAHLNNGDIHVTAAQKTTWSGKQDALTEAQLLAVNSGITATKLTAIETHDADTTIHITAEERTAWNAKQAALTEAQLAAVNSGITAAKVATYDGYATGKADVATTLSGYGITDGLTYVELA